MIGADSADVLTFVYVKARTATAEVPAFTRKVHSKIYIYRFFLLELFYYIYTMTDPVPPWRAPQKS